MKRAEIHRVVAARVLQDNVLEIRFSDGYVGRVDLAPALWGPVFEPLRKTDDFGQFRIEDNTIRWPNDADFCPNVLRCWCEAGEVLSQEETDSHFAQQLTERAAS